MLKLKLLVLSLSIIASNANANAFSGRPISESSTVPRSSADSLKLYQHESKLKSTSSQVKSVIVEQKAISSVDLENKRIYFLLDNSNIDSKQASFLKKQAEYLLNNKSVKVSVEGHADERGTDAYNEKLALHRANTVADELIKYGLERDRIDIKSYGKSEPLYQGHNESSWHLNRRVDLNLKG